MKVCPNCNTVYDDSNDFCQKCGVALIDKVETSVQPIHEKCFCQYCGAGIETSTKFCPQCGQSTIGTTVNDTVPQPSNKAGNAQSQYQDSGMIAAFKCVVFEKYITLNGRASRSEYWYYALATCLISTILFTVGFFLAIQANSELMLLLAGIVPFLLVIPAWAVGVRRLHDTGHSGWWLLVNFTGIGCLWLFFLSVQEGEKADNIYGPYPPRYF